MTSLVSSSGRVPTLGQGFALVRELYDAGYGVEFLVVRDPEDSMSVTIPIKGLSEEIKRYTVWRALRSRVARHGVEPVLTRDGIEFRPPEKDA